MRPKISSLWKWLEVTRDRVQRRTVMLAIPSLPIMLSAGHLLVTQ
jgi:hypothetical protein